MSSKILCTCGVEVSESYYKTHLTKAIHKNRLQNKLDFKNDFREELVNCSCGLRISKNLMEEHFESLEHKREMEMKEEVMKEKSSLNKKDLIRQIKNILDTLDLAKLEEVKRSISPSMKIEPQIQSC